MANKIITALKFRKNLLLNMLFFLLLSLFFSSLAFANNNAYTNTSTLWKNSGSIPADGSTTATIVIQVRDISGNNLSGDKVTLTSTSDPGLSINGSSVGKNSYTATTDPNGNVTFTIKSSNPNPGTDTFTAADTSDNPPVPLGSNGSVTITFTASASCSDTAPGSIPHLISAVGNGTNQVTLTWTDATDPVSYYLLAYGTASGQYIYGNPNIGGQGATSYTIGSLTAGKTYYFAIRAVNGCTSGAFSNEISAIAGGTPTPTPTLTQADTSTSDTSQQNTDNNVIQDTPTDIPTPAQNIQSIDIPTPTQVPAARISNIKIVEYLLICILVLGGIGGFIYWKSKKDMKKPINMIDENQKNNFS